MQGRQQILQHLVAIKLEMMDAAFHVLPRSAINTKEKA